MDTNDRIVIHPPVQIGRNDYTITVSYYIEGKRKQIRKTKIESSKKAKAVGDEIKKDLEEKMPYLKISSRTELPTLEEFLEEYLILKNIKVHGTKRVRDVDVKRMKGLRKKRINEITRHDIDKELSKLQEVYLYNTVNNTLATLNVLLNAAVLWDYLPANPAKGIKLPKPDETEGAVLALEIKECFEMLDKLTSPEIKLMTLIGFTLGLRLGEMLNLNPLRDIDEVNGTIKISSQQIRSPKGDLRDQPLKTKNSYRTLPVPPVTFKAIDEYKLRTIDGYLFDTRITRQSSKISEAYKLIGMPKEVTYHTMRHSYITNLISSGLDIKTVATLAGDTVETILKTYAHYIKSMEDKAKQAVHEIFKFG